MRWSGLKYILGVFFAVTFIILFFYSINHPSITGRLIATGGQVTDISFNLNIQTWSGFFGLLSKDYINDSVSVNGNDSNVTELNINLSKCYRSEIYATPLSLIDWDLVTPANHSEIDDYYKISYSDQISITRMFTQNHSFVVNGINYSLYSIKTNSNEKEYYIGILKQGITPIFVADLKKGQSFENLSTDYQFILPTVIGDVTTYNFFLDPSDDCNKPYIETMTDITANEGDEIKIIPVATDPEGYPMTISFSYPFNSLGKWQTQCYDSGNYSINVTVCNTQNYCDTQFVNVLVSDTLSCAETSSEMIGGGENILQEGKTVETKIEENLEEQIINTLVYLEEYTFEENIFTYDEWLENKRLLEELLNRLNTDESKETLESEFIEICDRIPLNVMVLDSEKIIEIPVIDIDKKNLDNVYEYLTIRSLDKKRDKNFVPNLITGNANTIDYLVSKVNESFNKSSFLNVSLQGKFYLIEYLGGASAEITITNILLSTEDEVDFDFFILLPEEVNEKILNITPEDYIIIENDIINYRLYNFTDLEINIKSEGDILEYLSNTWFLTVLNPKAEEEFFIKDSSYRSSKFHDFYSKLITVLLLLIIIFLVVTLKKILVID